MINERRVRWRGLTIGLCEYGDPQGRRLGLLHGLPGSRIWGEPLAQAARRYHLCIVAPDRPGYGLSDALPDYQAETIAQWLEGLVGHYGDQAWSWIGVSGGGPVAIGLACLRPQRVKALALVGSPVSIEHTRREDHDRRNYFLLRLVRHAPFLMPPILHFVRRIMLKHPEIAIARMRAKLNPSDRQCLQGQYLDILTRQLREGYRQGYVGVQEDIRYLSKPWPVQWHALTLPIQIWHGQEDRIVPIGQAKMLSQTWAHARYHEIPNRGHFLAFDEDIAESILQELIEAS